LGGLVIGLFWKARRRRETRELLSSLPVVESLTRSHGGQQWDEAAVPLDKRGVSRIQLTKFISQLQKEINADVSTPHSFIHAGPDPRRDAGPESGTSSKPFQFLNAHGLVAGVLKPLDCRQSVFSESRGHHRRG
jgi:hypothetical protein